jgi:hypothetical protein
LLFEDLDLILFPFLFLIDSIAFPNICEAWSRFVYIRQQVLGKEYCVLKVESSSSLAFHSAVTLEFIAEEAEKTIELLSSSQLRQRLGV